MTDLIFLVSCFISFMYLILILLFAYGVKKLPVFTKFEVVHFNYFSIIIPFRNEAQHLNFLLESLKNIEYPKNKFEIIFMDDSSSDNSVNIIEHFRVNNADFQISLLHQTVKSQAPKKEAIEKAIKIAKYEWIITTDADCIIPKLWLKILNEFIAFNNCDMVVAPVIFTSDKSLLQDFQQLDFLSLMGATQGGFSLEHPFLCNGANLCYKKTVFFDVNGFVGNKNIASGDDVFLMEKFLQRNIQSVKYLKNFEAIVQTQPQKTVKEFINQRIRWASKTLFFKINTAKIVGLIVLSFNFLLFISLLLFYLKWISFISIILFWTLKICVDYFLLLMISTFYQTKISFKKYLIFSFIYPFYVIIIGLFSFRKKYEWKGRIF